MPDTLIDIAGYLTSAGAARVDAILDAAGVPRRIAQHAEQEQTPARVRQHGQWRKYKVGKRQPPAQSPTLPKKTMGSRRAISKG